MCETKGAKSYKLIFRGCCSLSNEELAKTYKLDLLTDEELISVDLERNSLIDDYRHLDEMAKLRDVQHLKIIRKPFVSKLKKPHFQSPRKASKTFKYDLLNKFFRCMQSESDGFCRFMANELKLEFNSQDTQIVLMSAKDRAFARYEFYFDHMDNLYANGEMDKVLALVAKAMVHFHRPPKPVTVMPHLGYGYGPHYERQRIIRANSSLS